MPDSLHPDFFETRLAEAPAAAGAALDSAAEYVRNIQDVRTTLERILGCLDLAEQYPEYVQHAATLIVRHGNRIYQNTCDMLTRQIAEAQQTGISTDAEGAAMSHNHEVKSDLANIERLVNPAPEDDEDDPEYAEFGAEFDAAFSSHFDESFSAQALVTNMENIRACVSGALETISSIENTIPEKIQFGELTENVVSRAFRYAHGLHDHVPDTYIQLHSHINPRGPTLTAIPMDMKIMLNNLLTNAVKHTKPEEGTITLDVSHDFSGNIVMSVTDTGPGIHPDKMSKLYQLGELSSESASDSHGIGLPDVLKTVQKYGGHIACESVHEKSRIYDGQPTGTFFMITLPCVQRKQATKHSSSFALAA